MSTIRRPITSGTRPLVQAYPRTFRLTVPDARDTLVAALTRGILATLISYHSLSGRLKRCNTPVNL